MANKRRMRGCTKRALLLVSPTCRFGRGGGRAGKRQGGGKQRGTSLGREAALNEHISSLPPPVESAARRVHAASSWSRLACCARAEALADGRDDAATDFEFH